MRHQIQKSTKRAIIKVGDGRGFVMERSFRYPGKLQRSIRPFFTKRIIVTAAHCLPDLPPACSHASPDERTYLSLLGPLGDSTPSITTECLFVDPVAGIAVLAEPDGQTLGPGEKRLGEASDLFEEFVERAGVLLVSDRDIAKGATGWLLSLDEQWEQCQVQGQRGPGLWITEATAGIMGGMSGSPILLDDGSVIGVVVTSGGGVEDEVHTEGGPQPWLTKCLPGWLLQGVRMHTGESKKR